MCWFSKVEPRVTWTPDLLGRERISSMGLGVVVMTARGYRPSLSAKERLSQVCSGYSHAAISSHQAASNCGPQLVGFVRGEGEGEGPVGPGELSLGGFVPGLVPGRTSGDDAGLALDHDELGFGQGACDEGDSEGFAGFDLSANPLGASAGLSEATSGEDEPGVPVAVGWELGVAGVE